MGAMLQLSESDLRERIGTAFGVLDGCHGAQQALAEAYSPRMTRPEAEMHFRVRQILLGVQMAVMADCDRWIEQIPA